MKKKIFNILILLGLALGIIGGLLIPEMMKNISFLGTIYINLLRFMIVPIIFTSVTVTIYKSKREKSSILVKSIILFIIMFVVTFLLTSLVVWPMNPAKGVTLEETKWEGEIADVNASEMIVNFFPSNVVTMVAENSIIHCILVAFLVGIAATKVDKGEYVIDFIDGLKNISYKLLEWIMYLTPIGIVALVGSTVADFGTSIIGAGVKYIGIAYLCSFLVVGLVMILPVWIYAKVNPIAYIRNIWRVWIISTTTCSSAVTLPHTIKACNEKFQIPSKVTDIVIPLRVCYT